MYATICIIRYPTFTAFFGFLSMALFRLPLYFNKQMVFYKLMGSGKNGSFDKTPDLKQWAIFTVHKNSTEQQGIKELYGSFIHTWIKLFGCETCLFSLTAQEGHGQWDGKNLPGKANRDPDANGKIAVLTRATIRLSKLRYFWKNVAPVARQMNAAPGLLFSVGIGEIPWIKQATFSIWESKEEMKAFAYGTKMHSSVVKRTRQEKWYSEDMFVRFSVNSYQGTNKGLDPLKPKG